MIRIYKDETELTPGMEVGGLTWSRSHPMARAESMCHAHRGYEPTSLKVDHYTVSGKSFPGTWVQIISNGREFRLVTQVSRTPFENDAHHRHPVVVLAKVDSDTEGLYEAPVENLIGARPIVLDQLTHARLVDEKGIAEDALESLDVRVHDKSFEEEGWSFDAWMKDSSDTPRKLQMIW